MSLTRRVLDCASRRPARAAELLHRVGRMATNTATNTFLQRLIGAAALDAAIYEEVEADETATTQAFAVVLLSSLAAGVGARGFGGYSIGNVTFISAVALLAWAAWAL